MKFKLIASLILFNFTVKSQNSIGFPFEICQDRIVINYPVKNSSLKLIFDTGSNLNIINSDKSELLNIQLNDQYNTINVGYFDLILKKAISVETNIFGKNWCSISNNKISKNQCSFDGLVGASELLKKSNIDICFSESVIKIIDPKTFKHPNQNNTEILNIEKPSKGYETDVSMFIGGNAVSVSGEIQLSDSSEVNTQFLIDTGNKFEIALVVTDSLIIKRLSQGKEDYENFIGLNKTLDYTYLKYRLLKNQYSSTLKTFIFYQEPNIFSIFGTRKIGVLLGVPFFKRYNSVIIDSFEKKLYLVN